MGDPAAGLTAGSPSSADPDPGDALRWRDGLAPVAVGWLVARACVLAGYLLAHPLSEHLDTPRGSYHLEQGLFTWDGAYYVVLAEQWYSAVADSARFFPLYPALARVLAPLFGGDHQLALLVIANVSAFAGALLVWRLAAEALADRDVGSRAAWMLPIFPAGFVLVFAYTEGLAVVFVAGTLLALHRRRWLLAGAVGLLAALLRPVGGLVVVAILVEVVRTRPRPSLPSMAVALAGPVVGLLAAMTWIAATTRDFWLPVTIQQEIRGGFQDPITRVFEPIGEVLTGDFRDVYNLAFMWVLIALLAVAVRRGQPLSWIAYSGVSLLVLLSSQVTDSLGRYGMVVVPFVIALAQWAERRWQQALVGVLSCSALVWLTSEAWLGRLVP